jgi:hypothetical protein
VRVCACTGTEFSARLKSLVILDTHRENVVRLGAETYSSARQYELRGTIHKTGRTVYHTDEGKTFLGNAGNHLHDYRTSQPTRPNSAC